MCVVASQVRPMDRSHVKTSFRDTFDFSKNIIIANNKIKVFRADLQFSNKQKS